jgi:hypothetical protein
MKRLLTALVAVVALAMLPASAMAKDRNHDRIPDKWEKHFHLSLHKNQAKLDQDHDGLRNLAEFKDGTSPRKADSDKDGLDDGDEVETGHDPTSADGDHDGVKDGHENAGTVKSFEGGVLTITLAAGGELTGKVTDATEIECNSQDDQGDDDQGDDDSTESGDHSGPGGDDRIARASSDGGSGSDDGDTCTSDALKPGATVKEAELDGTGADAIFHDVELLG